MIEYYRRRAAGGFGTIIIEVVAVDRKGHAITNQIGLGDDEQIAGKKYGVDYIFNQEVTAEYVKEQNADAVILAIEEGLAAAFDL